MALLGSERQRNSETRSKLEMLFEHLSWKNLVAERSWA